MMLTRALKVLAFCFLAIDGHSFQPPEIVSKDGKLDVTLTVDMVLSLNGTRNAPGYNGNPIGPTIRIKPGDTLSVTLINNLEPSSDYDHELHEFVYDRNSEKVNDVNVSIVYNRLTAVGSVYNSLYGYWGQNFMNLHFHGAMFDPKIEDTREVVDGGKSKTYKFEIPEDQPPGLFWYHNHVHGTSQYSVMSGLYGFLVVEGTEQDITSVPEIADSTEVFLMLAETSLNKETKRVDPFIPIVMKFDWEHVTNGNLGQDTTFTFRKGERVLFRAVSASVEPAKYVSIDEHMLVSVAHDGYPARSIEESDTITIDSGSRLEFMTKFDKPGIYTMRLAPWNIGITGSDACGAAFNIPAPTCVSFDVERIIAKIIVEDIEVDTPEKALPQQLPDYHPFLNKLAAQSSNGVRTVTIEQAFTPPIFQIPFNESVQAKYGGVPTGFGLNGRLFTPYHSDGNIDAGTCETWEVSTNTPNVGHTFHVHSVPFLVTHVNGEEKTPFWRDTMAVNINITIHICFPRHDGDIMVHCHMPSHQDIGSAIYYTVVPKDIVEKTATTDSVSSSTYYLYLSYGMRGLVVFSMLWLGSEL